MLQTQTRLIILVRYNFVINNKENKVNELANTHTKLKCKKLNFSPKLYNLPFFHVLKTAWCRDRKIAQGLHEMTNNELDKYLRHFYAEARTKDGALYSRSSLLGIRNALERYLNNPPLNRGISISKGVEFQASNKLLQSQIKLNKRENKENVHHKPPIPEADLQKLKSSSAIRGDNPWGLLRNVWFHINLCWCRRGREGQRELTKQSFQFLKDDTGREYVSMTHDEATKNHPGGIDDVASVEKEARMYSTSNDQLFDGLNCLRMYLQKLNPHCEALFQYLKGAATQEDQVWYDNKPLGVHKLAGMMKDLSKLASLSKIYTNHSVRATAITLWSDAQVPSRHIMAISGHRSEASLRNYNARPSSEQLRACSDILSGALNGRPQESQHPSFTDAVTSSNLLPMNPNPTVVHSRNTAQQFFKYQPQVLKQPVF